MTAIDVASGTSPESGAEPDGTPPATTVPARTARRRPPRPRQLTMIRMADVLSVIGALVAAVATTGLLWQQFSPFSGLVGAVVVAWILFVFYYATLISFDEDRVTVRDRVSAVVVQSLAVLVAGALVFVILYTFFRGWPALHHLNFYTQDARKGGPLHPLTQSGALHAIVGTLIEVAIAMAIAIPLGILAAVFMNEVPGRYAQFIRTVVNAMTAMPDILAALFIYATLVTITGLSGLAAGCTLGITALPIVCRASDVVLQLMPGGLTEASYALGAGQWRTVQLITLPTVRSGLATAVILGAARAIGETAPPLLTSGGGDFFTVHLTHIPMNSLPLMAFLSTGEASTVEIQRGFGAAAVLLVLVLGLFAVARKIGGRGPGQLTPRQQRRRAAASRRDADRYIRHTRAAVAVATAGAAAVQEWQ